MTSQTSERWYSKRMGRTRKEAPEEYVKKASMTNGRMMKDVG